MSPMNIAAFTAPREAWQKVKRLNNYLLHEWLLGFEELKRTNMMETTVLSFFINMKYILHLSACSRGDTSDLKS